MAIDAGRMIRGALAGAAAAAVWAAQTPLDRKIFGVPYDDTELLGRALRNGSGWRPIGVGAHLANGAAFGAAYAAAAPSVPLPAWARGPAAGLIEGVGTWPLTIVSDRFHPARKELPQLWGSRAAFGQMLWRHMLFGALLGELERRLNPPDAIEPALSASISSSIAWTSRWAAAWSRLPLAVNRTVWALRSDGSGSRSIRPRDCSPSSSAIRRVLS
jgi:hypothetical protein